MTSREVKRELYNKLVTNVRLGTTGKSPEAYPICLTILRIMSNLHMITNAQREDFADEIADIMNSGVDLWNDEEAIKEYDAYYI